MSETQRIVALSHRAATRGDRQCLATVVHIEGSAYRKPGARMLLTSAGERAGTISGGCLESEVARKAWWLTAQGPRVERYSSFADEDGGMPYGLGCGGTVTLLLEQGPPALAVLSALAQTLSTREPAVVVTALGKLPLLARDESQTAEPIPDQPTPIEPEGSQFAAAPPGIAGPARTLPGLIQPESAPTGLPGTLAVLHLAQADAHERAASPAEQTLSLQAVYLRPNPANGSTHLRPPALHAGLAAAAGIAFAQQRSLLLNADLSPSNEQIRNALAPAYFVEYLAPPPAITIFGAGDDVQPIVELAHVLGWRVTVADGRAHLARRERFSHAAEVRVLTYADPTLRATCGLAPQSPQPSIHPQQALAHRPSGATASLLLEPEPPALPCDEIAVIMTHSYEQDRAILAALLPRTLRYLGILGPRHRTERLLLELCPSLGLSIDEAYARLHSPIGLDLGARDPATVALSIVAEIQATLSGRTLAPARPSTLETPSPTHV